MQLVAPSVNPVHEDNDVSEPEFHNVRRLCYISEVRFKSMARLTHISAQVCT
jgi:hypothetical protein